MNLTALTLIIPEKIEPERDAIAAAWTQHGGKVLRLGRFWEPPELDPNQVRVYGNDTFCLVLQQKLGFPLCSPSDDLIFQIPQNFLHRDIQRRRLNEIATLQYPCFAKSLIPKQIRSGVYNSQSELEQECAGLAPSTELIISEIVDFIAETRAFILDGQILDCALYENQTNPNINSARAFLDSLLPSITLPRAVVIDVGFLPTGECALIEFNAAWGAGLNGCNPELVLPAIAAASAS